MGIAAVHGRVGGGWRGPGTLVGVATLLPTRNKDTITYPQQLVKLPTTQAITHNADNYPQCTVTVIYEQNRQLPNLF